MLFPLHVHAGDVMPTLSYPPSGKQLYEVPFAERQLPAITAKRWLKVSDSEMQTESPAFDREGNLLFVEVFGGQVLKVDKQKRLSVLVPRNARGSAGLAIHKDGQLYVAGLGSSQESGSITAYYPNGDLARSIIDVDKNFVVDDLVFDSAGGFYFTDFKGTPTQPTGGVYYSFADGKTVVPILRNMALPNGIALSPDEKTLWVTEFATGLLHRVELSDPQTVVPFGEAVVYRFNGPSPDSMRVDADGNLYVAMYTQGRVLVLNQNANPIGQILIPGREEGHYLRTTSLAIKPGTNELFLIANDGDKGGGAAIFHAKGFAKSLSLYSHQ
ncbi:SMP-30/gluconolactonase/LRE family protein [Pseudomonas sp. FW305-E2]|nr:SMP-30/gluconolactonase/LRE family protein [Pseudomonas sp. FW305-E2]